MWIGGCALTPSRLVTAVELLRQSKISGGWRLVHPSTTVVEHSTPAFEPAQKRALCASDQPSEVL
jgi:hypothetical protein